MCGKVKILVYSVHGWHYTHSGLCLYKACPNCVCRTFYQAVDKLQPCWVRSFEKATYGNLKPKTTAQIGDFPLSQANYLTWQTGGWITGVYIYNVCVCDVTKIFREKLIYTVYGKIDHGVHCSLTLYVQLRVHTWQDSLKFFSMLVSWTSCFCPRHVQKLFVITLHKKTKKQLLCIQSCTGWSSKKWSLEAEHCCGADS